MDMWNAKIPSTQQTIKAAAIIANMISSPFFLNAKVSQPYHRVRPCALVAAQSPCSPYVARLRKKYLFTSAHRKCVPLRATKTKRKRECVPM
jgi:hypothetical protein